MPRPSSSTVTRSIVVDRDADLCGEAGHGFVDRVVDDFVHQMVQAAAGRVADVHGWTFPHMFQVGKVLQILGRTLGAPLESKVLRAVTCLRCIRRFDIFVCHVVN